MSIDVFTKYAQAVPTKDQEATTVPKRVHSGQGRNFESKVIQELCKISGISNESDIPIPSRG